MDKQTKIKIEKCWIHLLDVSGDIRDIADEIEENDPECFDELDDICNQLSEEANELHQLL